jgi:anti-anti-sigma regulatory factor
MEIFMFCDLVRYELSVRGSMCGRDAESLRDAILLLPNDSEATIDLRETAAIDATAAAVLASAVLWGQRRGVVFSILVSSDAASATLAAAGLSQITTSQPHHPAFV